MSQLNSKFLLVFFLSIAGVIANAQTQEICEGDIESYSVPETAGSTYAWSVQEAGFAGTITPTTPSGNAIDIDWSTTPVGSYTLSVTETNVEGCPGAPVSITVNVNPVPPTPEVTLTQPDCGETVGSMTVTSPTGTNYEYSIDGGTTYQSPVQFADLAPGTYEVITKNEHGCVSLPREFTINQPPPTPVTDPIIFN